MEFFSNSQVDAALLPKAEDISFQPVEQSYWKVLKWSWMIAWVIILITGVILFVVIPELRKVRAALLIIIPLLIICISSFWLMKKSFAQKAYALREKDLLYKSGWVIQRISITPFSRIQHCSVSSGVLARTQGLASLSVFTAGTEGADVKIPGLKIDKANEIRDFVLNKIITHEQPGNRLE